MKIKIKHLNRRGSDSVNVAARGYRGGIAHIGSVAESAASLPPRLPLIWRAFYHLLSPFGCWRGMRATRNGGIRRGGSA